MSSGHGSSRRQAYGRRMKDLRTRRDAAMDIDLEGPSSWRRGSGWDDDQPIGRMRIDNDRLEPGARPR